MDRYFSEILSNPYDFYKKMRMENYPLWVPHYRSDNSSDGLFFFFNYEDAIILLKNSKTVSKDISKARPEEYISHYDRQLLLSDNDQHLRLRKIVASYFGVQDISKFKEIADSHSKNIFNQIKNKKSINLIEEFAEIYSLNVITDILGIHNPDFEKIRLWSNHILNGIDSTLFINKNSNENYISAKKELVDYFEVLLDKKHYFDEKLIGYLSKQHLDNKLSRPELIGLLIEILMNGHFTVSALIGNGIYLLLNHKNQIKLLEKNEKILTSMIEEVLRLESPLQRTTYRIATEPILVNNFILKKNQQFAVVIGSANRDEKKFIDPDSFDITRLSNTHISFGAGTHNCIGKHLARLEAFSAFKELIKLIPNWDISQEIVWKKNSIVRALESLHVTHK